MASSSTTPGRAAKRADGARSRESILDAAEQLFAERGYAGTGIAAISKASGLPTSSIYWFFRDKQDLVAATIERAATRWLDRMRAEVGSERDPRARFSALVRFGIARAGGELPEFMRLAIQLAMERGERDPETLVRLRRVRGEGCTVIEHALGPLLEGHASAAGGTLARDLAQLAMAFAQGALVARAFDPDSIDPARLVTELEVALLAIAEHRLAEGS